MASGAHRLSLPRPRAPLPPCPPLADKTAHFQLPDRQQCNNCARQLAPRCVAGGVWQVASCPIAFSFFVFRFNCCRIDCTYVAQGACCMCHKGGEVEGGGHSPQTQLVALGCNKQERERGAGEGDSLDACNLSKVLAALPLSVPHVASVCVACGKCGIVFNLSKLKSATNRRTTTCNLPPKWTQKTRDLWQTKQTTRQGREGDRQTDKRRTTRAASADSRQVRGVVTGRGRGCLRGRRKEQDIC